MFQENARDRHVIRRGSLHPRQARAYARLGSILLLAFAATVVLLWTGLLARLLTWGDWGRLTVVDLLSFLIVAVGLVAVGVAYLLFTMRTALRRVEVDLRSADRRVESEVARMRSQVSTAVTRVEDARAADREEAVRLQQETMRRVHTRLDEAVAATRRVAVRTVRASYAAEHAAMQRDLHQRFLTDERIAPLLHGIKDLHQRLDGVTAQMAVLEETVEGRTRDAVAQLARDAKELQAGLIRTRAELLRTLEREIGQEVERRLPQATASPSVLARMRAR